MSIYLSEKHGVNPSVQKCFWCNKDIGVALFGRLPADRAEKMFGKEYARDNLIRNNTGEVEAPRAVVLSYEPCEGCEVWAHSKQGVFFVEVMPDEQGELRPTGKFNCVREGAVKNMLDPGPTLDDALRTRIVHMHTDDFRQIFRAVLKN